MSAGVAFPYDVAQIRAVEAGDVFVRLAQCELRDDVVPDLPRGAGGEGRDGAVWEILAQLAELAIFGTKFVAPFGDAMGFIYREERNGDALQPCDGVGAGEPLGGEV